MPARTFAGAMKSFFGLLPNQKLSEFAAELNALSQEEKQEFAIMLREVYPEGVDDPKTKESRN